MVNIWPAAADDGCRGALWTWWSTTGDRATSHSGSFGFDYPLMISFRAVIMQTLNRHVPLMIYGVRTKWTLLLLLVVVCSCVVFHGVLLPNPMDTFRKWGPPRAAGRRQFRLGNKLLINFQILGWLNLHQLYNWLLNITHHIQWHNRGGKFISSPGTFV